MPLIDGRDRGTEVDGTKSAGYCRYCYENGRFIEPEITLDGMLDRAAAVLCELYAMAPEKARDFVAGQIPHLKRWSGEAVVVCQSCGMSMKKVGGFGTEEHGEKSKKYCCYCYQNGAFTEPGLSREAMIQRSAPMLAEQYQISPEQAEEMMRSLSLGLERWRRSP